jgi:acyl carrier protein
VTTDDLEMRVARLEAEVRRLATQIDGSRRQEHPSRSIVREVLAEAFDLPSDDPAIEACAVGVTPGWDSLEQVHIVVMLEKRAGISIPAADVSRLTSFWALCDYVEERS